MLHFLKQIAIAILLVGGQIGIVSAESVKTGYAMDFENGLLPAGNIKNWGQGGGKAVISEKMCRSGKLALELSRDNVDGYSALISSVKLNVKKGEVITAEVWCANFSKAAALAITLGPSGKTLKTGLVDEVEWGEVIRIKTVADKDYNKIQISLSISGRGKVYYDDLKINIGGAETAAQEIVYPVLNDSTTLRRAAGTAQALVFRIPAVRKIYPNYVPAINELLNGETMLALAPGEFRPVLIGIHSLSMDGKITAKLTGFKNVEVQLLHPRYQKLRTEIKGTDFAIGPRRLIKDTNLDLVPGRSNAFFLIVHASDTAVAGIETGKLSLLHNGKPWCEIAIRAEVLPFRLVEPPVTRLMWAGWLGQNYKQDEEKLKQSFQDMKLHGMTSVEIPLLPEISIHDDKVQLDLTPLDTPLRVFKHVFNNPVMMVKGANDINRTVCHSINPKWNGNFPEAYKLISPNDQKRWKLFDAIYGPWSDYLRRQGIDAYMYAVDEPATHAWRELGITIIKRIRQLRPQDKIAITTNMEFAKTMDQYIDVNVFAYYGDDFDPIKAREFSKSSGDIFWVYGQCWSNLPRAAEVLRYEAGVYAWTIRVQGIGWWCYMLPVGNPDDDMDGNTQDFMMSYFTADGMDSTLNWEAIREGLTDMKYLYTLERLLAERPASPAAIKGRALLDEIRCATPQHRVYILSGNSIRNIPDAARLENWRGRLVESIKAIQ